jgi:hypothetical protein
VLNATSLAGRQLVAAGPGEVVVNVSAEGLTDSVVVRVAPVRPVITSLTGPAGRTHLGAGDTLTVRGFAMQQVTPTHLFPASLGLVAAPTSDSATLRLVTSVEVTGGGCTGRVASYRLAPVNVDLEIPVATPYSRARTGEIALAVGEAASLGSAEASCLRLAPQAANARYLLAWVDGRRIVQAETQFEIPAPSDVTVQVEDRSGPPSVIAGLQAGARQAPGASAGRATWSGPAARPRPASPSTGTARLAAATGATDPPFASCGAMGATAAWAIYCRTTPWTLGTTFAYQPIAAGRPAATARIIATRPKVVAAVVEADEALLAPAALLRIEATLEYLNAQYLASLRESFGTTRDPTSSSGSGQLVVVFEAGHFSNTIRTTTDGSVPQGAFSYVSMLLTPTNCYAVPANCPDAGVDEIIVHETAHTYQYLWNREIRNGQIPFGQTWSIEGGASLHELLTSLERHGIAWNANTQVEAFPTSDPRRQISLFANGNVSLFTFGYRSSAAFLRDLVQRLVTDRGVPFTEALREVQIGAMEGWYGIGFQGVQLGQGLVPRMRARFGPAWDPVTAMLEWTMSQAADDLTTNPRFQDLTGRTAPREANGVYVHNGIVPAGAVVAGTGATQSVTHPSGNTGVFQVDDPAAGGSYAASSTVGPSVRWLLLRVR